ncbi:MAG TPA: HAMP domain-containing histidine kinase [Candidatus Ventrimonas merdavium]|nr:HAMP domain-containing histidine kinase [Candidatus Ventrimonas merdavium]
MKQVRRFFRRYIASTIGIVVLFFTMNGALFFAVMAAGAMSGEARSLSVQALAEHVTEQDGVWQADAAALGMLQEHAAWAMVLDTDGTVLWEQALPEELPRSYTSGDVAAFSRWYLDGYPVKVWSRADGRLVVAGFQPGTWVKYSYALERPYVSVLLMGMVLIFFSNLGLMLVLILKNIRKVERAMSPILQGIQDLGRGRPRQLEERGELAEISEGLNRAGRYMAQKDNTRAEWIRGVSHDIRTPLSMVLGYASELEEDCSLPPAARRQAGIIRRQGEVMKALVEDLNLTTKLDYGLQPIRREMVDLVEIGRLAVSEVWNHGLPEQFELEFLEKHPGERICLSGDGALLRRMLDNLIRNSIVHNPEGCRIVVSVGSEQGDPVYRVEDDGVGMEASRLEALSREQDITSTCKAPDGAEHGLGLKLVRQIAKAHGGAVRFEHAEPHGLCVGIVFPGGKNTGTEKNAGTDKREGTAQSKKRARTIL